MSDSIIVPLPVYYGVSDTHNGRAGFPKPALFYFFHLRRLQNADICATFKANRVLEVAHPIHPCAPADDGAHRVVNLTKSAAFA
jgi:hypothetical protein